MLFHYEGFETVPHELMLGIQERFNNNMTLSFYTIVDIRSNLNFYFDTFGSLMDEVHSGTQRIESGVGFSSLEFHFEKTKANSQPNQIEPVDFNISGIIGDEVYTGLHSYHSHDYDTLNSMAADNDGMLVGVELEVETNRSKLQDAFTDADQTSSTLRRIPP